jgi:hypothetical protein
VLSVWGEEEEDEMKGNITMIRSELFESQKCISLFPLNEMFEIGIVSIHNTTRVSQTVVIDIDTHYHPLGTDLSNKYYYIFLSLKNEVTCCVFLDFDIFNSFCYEKRGSYHVRHTHSEIS